MVKIEKLKLSGKFVRIRFSNFLKEKGRKECCLFDLDEEYASYFLIKDNSKSIFSDYKRLGEVIFGIEIMAVELSDLEHKNKILKLLEDFEKENKGIKCILRI